MEVGASKSVAFTTRTVLVSMTNTLSFATCRTGRCHQIVYEKGAQVPVDYGHQR